MTDAISAAAEGPYWCLFADAQQHTIRELYETLPEGLSASDLVQLPADDWRVRNFNQLRPPLSRRIVELTASSFDSFMRLVEWYATCSPKPVFRGQGNYEWPLETVFERRARSIASTRGDGGYESRELKILVEAKRRLHHFLPERPKDDDTLGWMSLLRHQGVPTRLLDVTWSPTVAACFAVCDGDRATDAAVWIFSLIALERRFTDWERDELLGPLMIDNPYGVITFSDDYWPMPEQYATPRDPPTIEDLKYDKAAPWLNQHAVRRQALERFIRRPGVFLAEPHWMTRRMDVQRGAFLVPFTIREAFEANLCSFLGLHRREPSNTSHAAVEVPTSRDERWSLWADGAVIKVRIPGHMKPTFKNQLEYMNVREMVLFPDMDGFSGGSRPCWTSNGTRTDR